MNVVVIIRCLEILSGGDIRHLGLDGEGLLVHPHEISLGHLFHFIRNIIVVPAGLLDKPVVLVIDGVGS